MILLLTCTSFALIPLTQDEIYKQQDTNHIMEMFWYLHFFYNSVYFM